MIVDVYQYFKQHPKYNKLIGDDYLFVEYKCPINAEEYQLWTDSHLITYVINGKKDWISGDNKFEISKGDALFIRKGVYTTKQYFEVDYCVILFFINDNFIKNFMVENKIVVGNSINEDHDQIFKIDVDDSLDALIHSVFNYLKQGGDIPKSLVEIKFRELMFNIILNPKNYSLKSYFESLQSTGKSDLEYIMTKNFHYDLSMEEFAKLSGRSLSSFKRDFNQLFAKTPGAWLRDKRLNRAKTLLQNTQLSVSEICYDSGFKNTSHFNSLFKEKFGLPPKQFREKG